MTIYCPNCGKPLEDNINFCMSCGEKISKNGKTTETHEKTTAGQSELFFSPKEQIRKKGEKRYGKGSLKITKQNLEIDYKKVLGQAEHYVISRDKIEKAILVQEKPPVEFYGVGASLANMPWYILDIRLKDENGFQIYVGQPGAAIKKVRDRIVQKYDKIMMLLNPPGTLPEKPWEVG